MGEILLTNFKTYRCTTWTEGSTHGGDISATEVGADTAVTGTCTFAASTTVAGSGTSFTSAFSPGDLIYNYTNDSIDHAVQIASIQSDTSLTLSSSYTGATGSSKTAHKIAGSQVLFDNVSDAERKSGVTDYRKIFFKNLNADTVNIKCWINKQYSASNETISIALAVSNSDTQADATAYTYYTPDSISHANVLDIGALAQNGYKGIWIKRVVTAGGNGYAIDTMALGFGTY